jgi:uncharacterized membrane protein YfhO
MKDKLVKTNHKKFYYETRRFIVASFLCAGIMLSVTLPTYFSMKNAETESMHAEELEQENSENLNIASYLENE